VPDGLVVLDVREDDEWTAGHVEGSMHIPLNELDARLGEVSADAQTLVVCRSGNRSAYATAFLLQQGIDAVNLDGGLVAWASAGRRLVTDSGQPGQVW
jgi:rhodanese-related sulfurtransferase